MSFNTTENKRLIWSLLLETSYFKGFPASQKDMVKRVLDSVINELSQNPSINQMELIDKNREVVKQMAMYRDLWVQDGIINEGNQTQVNTQQSKQKSLPLFDNSVTAEDLRDQRNKQFNDSFNKKQTEMNQLLNASKPQEIDFSDSKREERIGGDMERLVAQAEAARQQQMDILMNGNGGDSQQQAEKWINGGRPLKIDNESKVKIESQNIVSPKQISQVQQSPQRKVHFSDNNDNIDNDIFSKLKQKSSIQNNKMQDLLLLERIEKLETTILNMQNNMNKLTELIEVINKNIDSNKYNISNKINEINKVINNHNDETDKTDKTDNS